VDDHCVTVRLETCDVVEDVVEDAVDVHVVAVVGEVDLSTLLVFDVPVRAAEGDHDRVFGCSRGSAEI
jgi:hypothetical protein